MKVTTARYKGSKRVTCKDIMYTTFLMQLLVSIIIWFNIWDNILSTKTKNLLLPKEWHGNGFYVQRYKLSNDILGKSGYYNHGNRYSNTSFIHEQALHLWRNKSFLRQVKPAIIQDEGFGRASLPFEKLFKINRQTKEISCGKLIKGEKKEQEKANQTMTKVQQSQEKISPEEYIKMTLNCPKFIHDRGYIMNSITKEEEQFPITFSILMYKDPWQFERLLRAIYRPQNHICVHVDGHTNDVIFKAVSGISRCLDNVFIASERIKVQWGGFTVLEAEIVCMRDLWHRSKKWKYFINLTGQEFPLRTNYELVKILKIYNGTNAIGSRYAG